MRPIDLTLWPVSFLYGAANHLRARAYRTGLLKSRRLDAVVISVGNLTVGGTGKTPMVLWIAQKLLAEGKSNKYVATLLKLSVHTVETHRSNILEKLNLHSMPELILYAVRKGVIS